MINGVQSTLATTSPVKGFSFTVPDSLLPESIANTASSSAGNSAITASVANAGVIERAVQSDGSPLPNWLKYDAASNTFSAAEIPSGTKAIEVKIQTIQNGKVLEESPAIVIDAK